VSRELIPFCKKFNIQYKRIGYWKAWYEMFSNLQEVGSYYTDNKKCY